MDVGETNSWDTREVITGAMMRRMLEGLESIQPNHIGEVANRYRRGSQEIGFIESVSKPFCGECNRARISADGSLYTCLFASNGNDLKSILRMGASKRTNRRSSSKHLVKKDDAYSKPRQDFQR